MQAYFRATRAIEDVLGLEQAKPVIEALNPGISALKHACLKQRPILKAEIKDELGKELASKADIAQVEASISSVESRLKADINMVKKDLVFLNSKFNWLIGIVIAAITPFNPQFVQLIKLLFKFKS